MGIIAKNMPLVAQQAGVWEGEYVHVDANHQEIDRHQSRLICRLHDSEDDGAILNQSNIYTWADGTREIRFFEGVYKNDRLHIKNDLIDGWTASIDLDETNSTIMVQWVRPGETGFRYYEIITLSEDGQQKNRTWHWYRNNQLFQRTLINENRISDDWQAHDSEEYLHYQPRQAIK